MEQNRFTVFIVIALLVIGTVVGGSLVTYSIVSSRKAKKDYETADFDASQAALVEPAVQNFCGSCHPTPLPSSFPKDDWYEEVVQGFEFYAESGRSDLDVPNLQNVTKYFEFFAPSEEEFVASLQLADDPIDCAPFATLPIERSATSDRFGTSHLSWVALQPDQEPQLLFCDMGSGTVGRLDPLDPDSAATEFAKLTAPVHAEVCDLDGDGFLDIVVADLGSVRATDDLCGSVEWLRATAAGGPYEVITLAEGIGRTCDVRPGDFNGDGKLDLIVAEFGWQRSGHILLLTNTGVVDDALTFEKTILDSRHGTVAIQQVDMNGDGHLDFVALVSQEYEAMDLFLNRGDGTFAVQSLFMGPGPSYGSSGFELVDLDSDDDLDVLYVNGDSFDSDLIKPYHTIQWLRNDGELKFEHQNIAHMPGVHRATPGDIDGDGDLDIVASSLLPIGMRIDRDTQKYDSVMLLVNDGNMNFSRTTIEAGDYSHPTSILADIDQDNDLDLVVGVVALSSVKNQVSHTLTWFNESEQESSASGE